MTYIKICGVKSVEEGYLAAKEGADFVGIVMHAGSKRYVNPMKAQFIATAIRKGGANPVAVFLNESKSEVLNAVSQTDIATIQTYEDFVLPKNYTTIYANPRKKRFEQSDGIFLFDGPTPGNGQKFRPEHLPASFPSRFFLAGGIDSENVAVLLEAFQPTGVDISSSVETSGKKDLQKIQTFIQKVRDYDKTIR